MSAIPAIGHLSIGDNTAYGKCPRGLVAEPIPPHPCAETETKYTVPPETLAATQYSRASLNSALAVINSSLSEIIHGSHGTVQKKVGWPATAPACSLFMANIRSEHIPQT